ncbi:serine/threonine-protein phosphatase [Streptomyces sp. HU2014]|uniref:Phosphatase n=1 Tax=Streptomyces albireticuli TaxID=1940 RepID=A0A1Z2L3S7_9ACTN|nr:MULTISPECIES: PP2C family protein-serine/threonine phosphatase [Streptomyces]ARZ68955.1 phosphatase [Streptomyces albireticuli]UQI48854.1 serine/threonine-protein phosphatase [Streptomyces sp. HU2014]
MTTPHLPKVAGINPPLPAPSHTPSSSGAASPTDPEDSAGSAEPTGHTGPAGPSGPPGTAGPTDPMGQDGSDDSGFSAAVPSPAPNALVQDRLAGWISDLTTLQELTERLTRTGTLDAALHEVLRAGAALVGARRGLVTLHPARGPGHEHPITVGLGLGRADLGHIETIPTGPPGPPGPHSLLFGDLPPLGSRGGVAHPDIAADETLDPRHREVAARLGYGAGYAVPLESDPRTGTAGRLGAAVWLYDEPAEPTDRQRHLLGLYRDHATEHLARLLELAEARETVATLREELLPSRLPRIPGVRLAVRHRTGPRGGGDWYDALPLPEGALGLAVGAVTGSGPSAVAAMGRLRASLRAYAVMEGEDPVAVLSDLELLLRLTEPARSATALFAYCEPAERRVVLAGAGHCPPLIVGEHRAEFVETSLSAPLGMLACWEAPSVEVEAAPGETLIFYSDGLLHRTGDAMDRGFARLHAAAASVPRAALRDPDAVVEHILRAVLPDGGDGPEETGTGGEDVILLAARFD